MNKRNLFALVIGILLVLAYFAFIEPRISNAQDNCAFADTWMGAVNNVLPDNVSPFDYRVTDGKWNFPEWVSDKPLLGTFAPNGGYLIYGFDEPEGQIITDPAVYEQQTEWERITYHMIFCDLSTSPIDGKQHNIRVYEVRQ